MYMLGRMPVPGDSVSTGECLLHVEAMDGLRIDRVRIEAQPEISAAEAGETR